MLVICFGRNDKMVDIHHIMWVCLAMAGLKSFLNGVAPLLGVTGSMLYERQRALVGLGVIASVAGRGPGSGAPLTAENFAAVLISLLATDNLSEVDQRVVAILNAVPDLSRQPTYPSGQSVSVKRLKGVTFQSEVALVLDGQEIKFHPHSGAVFQSIRVSRFWRGQIVYGVARTRTIDFIVDGTRARPPVSITAELEDGVLDDLVDFFRSATNQAGEEPDE